MKVLLDSCVFGPARVDLEAAGHDVVWAGEWSQDPGDEEILGLAPVVASMGKVPQGACATP